MGSVIRSAAWVAALAWVGLAAEARAQDCRTDADCESGFACRKGESAGCAVPPSVPGEDPKLPPDCAAAPMEEEIGECAPLPIACEADADCPGGLKCRKSEGEACTAASAGGNPAPECEPRAPAEGHCSYVPIACTRDSDCKAGDACTALGGEQACTSTPGVPCNGGNCPPPPEPTCTTVERNFCFPRRVDCATNADCAADRRCVMLPEEIQEDAPEPWQGATRLCLEEGLALLVEGRVDAEGSTSHAESSTTKGVANDASGEQPQSPVAGGEARADDPGFEHRRACAAAAPGGSRSSGATWLPLWAVAIGLGLVLARRRG